MQIEENLFSADQVNFSPLASPAEDKKDSVATHELQQNVHFLTSPTGSLTTESLVVCLAGRA